MERNVFLKQMLDKIGFLEHLENCHRLPTQNSKSKKRRKWTVVAVNTKSKMI